MCRSHTKLIDGRTWYLLTRFRSRVECCVLNTSFRIRFSYAMLVYPILSSLDAVTPFADAVSSSPEHGDSPFAASLLVTLYCIIE